MLVLQAGCFDENTLLDKKKPKNTSRQLSSRPKAKIILGIIILKI